MPPRASSRHATLVLVAIAVGAVVRSVRLAGAPLMHPDGPAYLGLAQQVLHGRVTQVLGGYYSPLYPLLIAPFAAVGVPLELAGRIAATVAGLAALPLVYVVVRRLVHAEAAAAAVLVAALQPALVKSAADVLPETLAGTVVLAWLAALVHGRALLAGVLAGTAYLARPEGVLLIPLGLVWLLGRARRPRAAFAYAALALAVMAPAVVALHDRTGAWQLSPREGRITSQLGMPEDATFLAAALDHPLAIAAALASGAVLQLAYDAKALSPFLWLPFGVGLVASGVRGWRSWPLVVAGAFTALPLALNPSPRYAVPLLPLLLPWVGSGLVVLGRRLQRARLAAAAALGVALVVQALWISKPLDAACSREVSRTVLERYGPGQALVAVDGRFAYGARGRALVPRSTAPDEALALAERHGARLWLTRPAWIRPPWQPPPDARVVARPCGGTFVLFELEGRETNR
jgi:4-amino-4-deoxy-L-arabinose transferase-like glycosyltransferase